MRGVWDVYVYEKCRSLSFVELLSLRLAVGVERTTQNNVAGRYRDRLRDWGPMTASALRAFVSLRRRATESHA